jgi:hypothetical protein
VTTKDTIQRDLAAVGDLIASARRALTRNELVDIGEIPERVRGVMGSITDLPPDDAVELRPQLLDLLSDFKSFAGEVSAKIADIETADAPGNRAAAAARTGD